jgi:[ribosomal protein S5]-alanine N-acetyltransferase
LKKILEGSLLYLRFLKIEDANGNYPNWLNDDEVCLYNSHGDILYTKDMAIEYIKSVTNNSTCKVFAICDKQSDKHIGNISLQSISKKNQSAEFAILMGEKMFWGKGFAKEAGLLLIKHGFEDLNLHRIFCGTSSKNIPMQKLAKKLNFIQEGISKDALLKNGHFVDLLHYGLINPKHI